MRAAVTGSFGPSVLATPAHSASYTAQHMQKKSMAGSVCQELPDTLASGRSPEK